MVTTPGEPLFDPGPASKVCGDCRIRKPLEDFPRIKNLSDGGHRYRKDCHNARGRETVARLCGSTRHYHLMRRYGIGADDFDRMLADQDGLCAICGPEQPEHVDHSHDAGEVRGILCFNGGLGQFPRLGGHAARCRRSPRRPR